MADGISYSLGSGQCGDNTFNLGLAVGWTPMPCTALVISDGRDNPTEYEQL